MTRVIREIVSLRSPFSTRALLRRALRPPNEKMENTAALSVPGCFMKFNKYEMNLPRYREWQRNVCLSALLRV